MELLAHITHFEWPALVAAFAVGAGLGLVGGAALWFRRTR